MDQTLPSFSIKVFEFEFECGLRKYHNTSNHLFRFETFIKYSFARKKHVLTVFVDLGKVYDTTWKRGILSDLCDLRFHRSFTGDLICR